MFEVLLLLVRLMIWLRATLDCVMGWLYVIMRPTAKKIRSDFRDWTFTHGLISFDRILMATTTTASVVYEKIVIMKSP